MKTGPRERMIRIVAGAGLSAIALSAGLEKLTL
jgi:hypothetical protein